MNVSVNELLFYSLSFVAALSAFSVVVAKNPVKAALCLVLTFFTMAMNWMLLEAEFLAIVLILVYVGAVMVLFLFVVMMIDIESATLVRPFVRYWPISLGVSCLLIGMMTFIIMQPSSMFDALAEPVARSADYSHVKAVAHLLFSDFLLPFEIAGVILLVAMIAAIGLTFRGSQTPRAQQVDKQVKVRKSDRLRVVQVSKGGEA